ncbi:hypothetical protein BRADI_2g17580v3 [Brachypodium distachyon]|uniref:Uncharacterized protein n=1 Tax=Brachypodium distachyon TaxID=15368 RepID=A0A2K2D929_BRADI|nr:hypothetical protein BRADI_2g17580v3 [Brachypodium distachyon]
MQNTYLTWRARKLQECFRGKMEHDSGGGWSESVGDGLSIFVQSIDVRRPVAGKGRRRAAAQRNLSSGMEEVAISGKDRLHRRPEKENLRAVLAEPEVAKKADIVAEKLERQVEGKSRQELLGTRARSSRRRKGGVVFVADVDAPGAGIAQPRESGTGMTYAEVMQELDRVKRELAELQREVKAAREAKLAHAERDLASASTSSTETMMSSGSFVIAAAKEAHVDVAKETEELEEPSRWTVLQTMGLRRDMTMTRSRTSVSSELEAWLSAASSDEELRHHDGDDKLEVDVVPTRRHEVRDDSSPWTLQAAAEAELDMARTELESFKGEESLVLRSTERANRETARVAEEIGRIEEQEKKAGAQVQQLNARLVEARSRLAVVRAADKMADEMLSDLKAELQKLDEETEAAAKEKALTEEENRCAIDNAESVESEIAAAEQRIKVAVRELEAVRVSEAMETGKLKAVVESVMLSRLSGASLSSGNVTIPRFEYEYLTSRVEVVRVVADKKVAAAEAWVEARQAGEKEMIMRAEAIERELGEAESFAEAVDEENTAEVQQIRPRRGPHSSKRPMRENGTPVVTPRRKRAMPVSPVPRNLRTSSSKTIHVKDKKIRVLIPNYLKLISGKCTGRN